MNHALRGALLDVTARYENLPPIVHVESPRDVLSRILAGTDRDLGGCRSCTLTYDQAVQQAALALALVVAVDRAEMNSTFAGGDAA